MAVVAPTTTTAAAARGEIEERGEKDGERGARE